MPYNSRQYNDSIPYDLEGGGPVTRLTQSLIAIQNRKNEQARRDEELRILEAERQRNNQIQDEDRRLKVAELNARLAALQDRQKITKDTTVATTSLAPEPPPAEDITPQGAPEDIADENRLMGLPPPPEVPLDQADLGPLGNPAGVPDQLPLTIKTQERSPTPIERLTVAGQPVEIPMYDRRETAARAAEDFKTKLEQERQLAEAKDVDVTIPDDPKYGALAGVTVPKTVAAVILRGTKEDPFANYKGVGGGYLEKLSNGTVSFHDTTPSVAPGEQRVWATRNENGKQTREFVTKDQLTSAPPGLYSDVKPATSSIRKADPAKLEMALNALGDEKTAGSLWDLATRINVGKGMMAALRGVGRRRLTEISPEMASQSNDEQLKLINLYQSGIKGFASSIAKAFGEAGVLTNQDIERAVGLFPRPGESPDATRQKLVRVKEVMMAGRSNPDGFRAIFDRDPKPIDEGGTGITTPGAPSVVPFKILGVTPPAGAK